MVFEFKMSVSKNGVYKAVLLHINDESGNLLAVLIVQNLNIQNLSNIVALLLMMESQLRQLTSKVFFVTNDTHQE